MGILSLTCLSIFAAIPGVICGHKAMGRIKRSGGALTGGGLAIGGLVTGYIGVAMAIFVVPLMMAVAIPNFVKGRQMAIKSVCVHNLQTIEEAKQKWALENKKQPTDVPTANDLAPYLPNGMPECPASGVYSINALNTQATCSVPGHKLEE